jgi:hypothetical protein
MYMRILMILIRVLMMLLLMVVVVVVVLSTMMMFCCGWGFWGGCDSFTVDPGAHEDDEDSWWEQKADENCGKGDECEETFGGEKAERVDGCAGRDVGGHVWWDVVGG